MAGDDVLAGAPGVPVSRCPAQGGAAVLRPGRRGGPRHPAQRGRAVAGRVGPGRVPASGWSWLRQLPPFLPPAGPGSASSVCDGSFETKF